MSGAMNRIESGLRRILGDRARFDSSEIEKYMHDASYLQPERPLAVVFPKSTAEVSRVLRFCNGNGIAMTVRGGGTSLTGACIPAKGGIVMSMERLKRILEINTEDQYAVVQSDVVINDLNKRLGRLGYFYPPDPGSSSVASVGGTIATNAGGLRGVMYGSTKRWVLGVEAVMADGTVIETGSRTMKLSRGYDLTSLLVGSEGTLAVITKAILRIEPSHEKTGSIVAYYRSMGPACEMLYSLRRSNLPVVTAEFMDRKSVGYMGGSLGVDVAHSAKYMIFIGILSSTSSLASDMRLASVLVKKSKPISSRATISPEEVAGEYLSRKELHDIMADEVGSRGLGIIIGDVVVPLSRLALAVRDIERMCALSRLGSAMFGHIGEGNIHLNVFADLGRSRDVAYATRMLRELGRIAIRHGGSVSAEHGIGLEKKQLLKDELAALRSPKELTLMKDIKKAFDPNGILNPGKIFD